MTTAITLHMIRADINATEFHRWADSRGISRTNPFDEGLAMHCLLTETFGDLAPKPFRIITPQNSNPKQATLYGYTQHTADELRHAASTFADPLQAKILPNTSIDSKPMPNAWQQNQRLGFETLIRPTIRHARGSTKARKERDAFQAAAELHPPNNMPHSREQIYTQWLKNKLQANNAAQLESANLTLFRRTPAIRKLHAKPSEGPHAIMRGTLTITNPQAFNHILTHGIGRHKAYGYGMLLLRPTTKQHP